MITVGDIYEQIKWVLGLNPSLHANNVGYGAVTHAINFSYLHESFFCHAIFFSNFPHCIPCQFSLRIQFSFWFKRIKSVFINTITHIVGLSSNEKMIWTNASRIITFMTDKHSLWNFSNMNHVRNSMSEHVLAFSAAHSNSSISFRIFGSKPNPARFCFFDFFKKSDFKRGSFSRHNINPLVPILWRSL